jgi:hypothetical protein
MPSQLFVKFIQAAIASQQTNVWIYVSREIELRNVGVCIHKD